MTTITSKPFGKLPSGEESTLYTFTNASGNKVSICSLGAAIVSIEVPDRNGKLADVVLGYDNVDGYVSRRYFFGASVGRSGNRIAGGKFKLNGKEYQLNLNEGKNHLHGGFKGFDTYNWNCTVKKDAAGDYLELKITSPDGDENYPGKLDVTLTYSFNDLNELKLRYQAVSDADTLCNLTNHSYFNLAGHDTGNVLKQKMKIYAGKFTETDEASIPTGKDLPVAGTPMDFLEYHVIGDRIEDDFAQLRYPGGYDNNWVLDKGHKMGVCAEVYDEASGRHMTCSATNPCIQFYCANFIEGDQKGKNGFVYQKRAGLCLESQYAPDAINHPEFESPVLKAGRQYDETTVYKFDVL